MFNDVKSEQYSKEDRKAIQFLLAMGGIAEDSHGAIYPQNSVSNEEFCMILSNIFQGTPDLSNRAISKFYADSWAAPYIQYIETLLKKLNQKLWFDAQSINVPISCRKIHELLLHFFKTLIKDEESLPQKDTCSQENASRLWVAKAIYEKCMDFYKQTEKFTVEELLEFWKENDLINPCRLLGEIYSSGNVEPPKWKVKTKRNTFYKLLLLQKEDPENVFEIYKKLNDVDRIEERYDQIFPLYTGSTYHYTTLAALYSMLDQSNAARSGEIPQIKMFLSNAEYLNDPEEGSCICFQDSDYGSAKSDMIVHPKSTYIISLSKDKEERLPMWVQYADNGMGCRIKFEVNESHNFREIKYYSSKDMSEVSDLINIAKEFLSCKENSTISQYARDIVDKIRYQVKNEYYDHEQEVRFSIMQIPQLSKKFSAPRLGESFPRLYYELDTPLKIESVTLGPKCPNPNAVALFLYHCGIPSVEISKIKYC
ncbi:DUF2971 domain-containing protein [Pseudoflavonifractor phocaeensis]|uniref:DUF2971 domain-containing protein n=1 Tax=Pseudoflavonifractor phocaeensis TaxID=1870988 RepID=UPI00195BB0D7|nr:DUF2971 domain-containing protein [Pseudoflavonifractor phocaeensis]MBM6724770.1 DUF2971 domain-containing protein [Pseudoflavonifractor phocaeensis]